MGWSAWALDHLWLVAGGSLIVSFLLHFLVTWLFKNSGNQAHSKKPSVTNIDNESANEPPIESNASEKQK